MYRLQFQHIANRYKWNDEQIYRAFARQSFKVFRSRPVSVQTNFKTLCKKMNERFGRTDLPHIVRRQLQDLRQSTEESLEEYAERAQELATEGYPNTS